MHAHYEYCIPSKSSMWNKTTGTPDVYKDDLLSQWDILQCTDWVYKL